MKNYAVVTLWLLLVNCALATTGTFYVQNSTSASYYAEYYDNTVGDIQFLLNPGDLGTYSYDEAGGGNLTIKLGSAPYTQVAYFDPCTPNNPGDVFQLTYDGTNYYLNDISSPSPTPTPTPTPTSTATEAQNVQDIHDWLASSLSTSGFAWGLGSGIVFAGAFWLVYVLRKVYSDRDD